MYAYSGRVRHPISDIYSVVGRVSRVSGVLVKLKPACGAAWAFAMDGIVDGRTPCAPISRISQLFALFAFLTCMNDRRQGNITTGLRLWGCTVFCSFGLVLAILTIQGLRWFSQARLPGSSVLSAFLRRTPLQVPKVLGAELFYAVTAESLSHGLMLLGMCRDAQKKEGD